MFNTAPRVRPEPALSFARAIAGAAAFSGLAGCGGITANSPEAAQVRFVQASVESPAVDMYLDNSGAAYNLSFGTVTSYVSLVPGDYRLSAHRGGTGQALVSGQAVLSASKQYTAIVSNTLGNLKETIYPDASTPATSGTIGVRVINATSISGRLDVYLVRSGATLSQASPVIRELGAGAASSYDPVAADQVYIVIPVPSGSAPRGSDAAVNATLAGASGAVRTIIVTDSPVKSSKVLTALVLDDYDAL